MASRGLLFPLTLMTVILFGCAKPVYDGNACFESSECHSGSVCAKTVYDDNESKFCMKTCTPDIVRCEGGEACLQAGPAPPDADAGTDAGTGTGADAGTDAAWLCFPGSLEHPDFCAGCIKPVVIGGICTVSLDCVVGGVCVCVEGAVCEEDDDPLTPPPAGPTCEEACDPNVASRCPRGLACTDLGNGRGFCDPTTFEGN